MQKLKIKIFSIFIHTFCLPLLINSKNRGQYFGLGKTTSISTLLAFTKEG